VEAWTTPHPTAACFDLLERPPTAQKAKRLQTEQARLHSTHFCRPLCAIHLCLVVCFVGGKQEVWTGSLLFRFFFRHGSSEATRFNRLSSSPRPRKGQENMLERFKAMERKTQAGF